MKKERRRSASFAATLLPVPSVDPPDASSFLFTVFSGFRAASLLTRGAQFWPAAASLFCALYAFLGDAAFFGDAAFLAARFFPPFFAPAFLAAFLLPPAAFLPFFGEAFLGEAAGAAAGAALPPPPMGMAASFFLPSAMTWKTSLPFSSLTSSSTCSSSASTATELRIFLTS